MGDLDNNGMTFKNDCSAETKFTIEHVYLQDPHFSALDEEFLRSKGYEILHTPESDHHISESTFLFTPGAEQAVEESSLAAALPALYIHNDMSPLWLMPPLGPLVEYVAFKL